MVLLALVLLGLAILFLVLVAACVLDPQLGPPGSPHPGLSPSVKAACADAATSNPELEDGTTSPLGLPGPKGQWRTVRAPESEEKERTPVDREERAEEAEVMRKEDRRWSQQPVKSQNANGGGNQTESAPEVSAILTEALDAHRELSSHASGEAWLTQVRP
ncbi:hypothetical protein NDU88_005158 [Pleurodeles waltl]|uniref:Uncharacterized protein n=1 Tax=Pleurodeles waltl TaxID=8319 RepID=A0AAV7LNR8_PLEWA|nr:hypothetical protein NDU88_005158 [Pleurodeles waltl]